MAKKIKMTKIRRQIAVAYNMSAVNVPQEMVDEFINYRKVA